MRPNRQTAEESVGLAVHLTLFLSVPLSLVLAKLIWDLQSFLSVLDSEQNLSYIAQSQKKSISELLSKLQTNDTPGNNNTTTHNNTTTITTTTVATTTTTKARVILLVSVENLCDRCRIFAVENI